MSDAGNPIKPHRAPTRDLEILGQAVGISEAHLKRQFGLLPFPGVSEKRLSSVPSVQYWLETLLAT